MTLGIGAATLVICVGIEESEQAPRKETEIAARLARSVRRKHSDMVDITDFLRN
jgi:hypothetical protein